MVWPKSTSLALIALACLAGPAVAQDEEVRTIPFDGVEVFCHVLNEVGLKPVLSLDEKIDPKEAVIIVFGYQAEQKIGEIHRRRGNTRFVSQGGSLLIATDYRFASGMQISGRRIQRRGKLAFGGQEACPMIPYGPASVGHPLFQHLHQGIATNCPSEILVPDFQALLSFPQDDRFPIHPAEVYMVGSSKDAQPQGRTLIIAGHGMFMNGMMLQPSADNFLFAVNAVQWLSEAPNGTQRTKALFIVDGAIITNFDADLSPKPPPLPLPTVRKLDRLLRGIEEEGIIPRMLAEHLDMNRTVAVVLACATFLLLIYGAKKFMEGRHLPETTVPLAVGSAAQLAVVPVMSERLTDRMRRNDLGDEARAAVQEWFREHAGVAPEHCSFRLERSARQRASDADFILKVGQTATPVRVTRGEFRRLMESLARLTLALEQKQIVLLIDGKEVRQG